MNSKSWFNLAMVMVLLVFLIFDPMSKRWLNLFFWMIVIGFVVAHSIMTNRKPPRRYYPPLGYGNGFVGGRCGGFGSGFRLFFFWK